MSAAALSLAVLSYAERTTRAMDLKKRNLVLIAGALLSLVLVAVALLVSTRENNDCTTMSGDGVSKGVINNYGDDVVVCQ